MNNALDELLQQPGIWRGGMPQSEVGRHYIATGYDDLDHALPGGGWPSGTLTEILHDHSGIGELRLLMPALAQLSRQGRWVAMIAPPYIPYAPALAAQGVDLSRLLLIHPKADKDSLWALEQALRAGTCGAVLAWPQGIDERALRRLQLAAETGKSWGILFRSRAEAAQTSTAALRLELDPSDKGIDIRFLKCRGALAQQEVSLDLERRLPAAEAPAPRGGLSLHARSQRVRGLSQLDLPLPPGSVGGQRPTEPPRPNR